MKKIILIGLVVLFWPRLLSAQSETIYKLKDKLNDPFSVYFYHNTLSMLNQSDDKDFDELIKDIEKLRLLMVEKTKNNFGTDDYQKLLKDYKAESFEEVMTMRHDGKNFDIYYRDRKGSKAPGTVILVSDSTNLYILDMLGTIDVRKAGKLFSTIDNSSEIGNRLQSFMSHDNKKKHNPEGN